MVALRKQELRNDIDWIKRQSGCLSCGIYHEEGHNRQRCPNANPTSTSGSGSGRGTNQVFNSALIEL